MAASTTGHLTKVGPEQVIIGGHAYACTKYSAVDEEGTAYYWLSPGVPFPVKYMIPTADGTYTAELTDWS